MEEGLGCLAVILLYAAVTMIYTYWPESLLVVLPVLSVGVVVAYKRHSKKQRVMRDRTIQLGEARVERQRQARQRELEQARATLTSATADLAKLIHAADLTLGRAQAEFEVRAFAPFWDEIESATIGLTEVQRGIDRVQWAATRLLHAYTETKTSDRLDVVEPDQAGARLLVVRFEDIVRRAQRDFEFAQIYEVRRTNQILAAGFKNLGEALRETGSQILRSAGQMSQSIGDLRDEVGRLAREQRIRGRMDPGYRDFSGE